METQFLIGPHGRPVTAFGRFLIYKRKNNPDRKLGLDEIINLWDNLSEDKKKPFEEEYHKEKFIWNILKGKCCCGNCDFCKLEMKKIIRDIKVERQEDEDEYEYVDEAMDEEGDY